jgi:hypothetical protein
VKRLALTALSCLCLAASFAIPTPQAARAQAQEPEETLPSCGIRYPGGYDPNTVGVASGRVAAFDRPERGPVSFRLDAGGESYIVLAAPAWYWDEQHLAIAIDDQAQVKGSKSMGADGRLYLIAREISVSGSDRLYVFRDARGKPAWSGCGPRGSGRQGQ